MDAGIMPADLKAYLALQHGDGVRQSITIWYPLGGALAPARQVSWRGASLVVLWVMVVLRAAGEL